MESNTESNVIPENKKNAQKSTDCYSNPDPFVW